MLGAAPRPEGTERVRWAWMGVRRRSVALAALIVGSTLAVDPGGASPFGPARWWVISTLALLGGGLALRDGDRRLHRPTIVLWAALLALLTAAALAGDDVRVALLGHPVRHLGVITWLLFALLFVAGQQLGGDADRRVLVRGVALATAGIGLWCAWELTVGRPVDVGADTDRLLGPFGSAAMLGAGTALLVPPAVGLALDTTERRAWRAVAAIGGVLGVTALVGSGSRAALVGIAVAGVVLLVRNHSNVVGQRSLGRRRPTMFVVGGAVVALALVAPRLGEVFDRTEGASSRFDEWSLALDVIADHPVLGVGPEGYRIAAVGTVDADYERSYRRDRVLPDRAHSGPLDVALDGGVLAALMHLTLVCSVLAPALHRSRGARPTATGFVVGLLAYAVQQLLLFPLAELDGIWWLLAGTAVAAPTPAPTRALRRVGTAALVLAPVALVAGLLGVAADRLAHRALTDADPTTAVGDAERAVDLRPDDLVLRSYAAHLHLERGTLADVDAAIDQADAALRWSPHDPIALDDSATALLARAGITGDTADVDAAVAAWRALVELDPVRARWQIEYGRAAALAGDVDTARAAWTAALALRPDDPTAADLLHALDGVG